MDEAALSLALLDHPGTDLAAYHDLLDAIEARLKVAGGDAEAPAERADALAGVLGGEFGFMGDAETYDDPANADLLSVLNRRRGLPVKPVAVLRNSIDSRCKAFDRTIVVLGEMLTQASATLRSSQN